MLPYLKILLLEDSPEDVGLLKNTLQKDGLQFQMLQVNEKDEFVAELIQFKPNIILSDHSLPQFNSQEALKIKKEIAPDTPFILVTGAISEEFAVAVLKQGADDYVLKSNLSRLGPIILRTIIHQQMKMEKSKVEEDLRKQNLELKRLHQELDKFVYIATHDLRSPLTTLLGLINIVFSILPPPNAVETYLKKMRYTVNKLDHILKEIMVYTYNARIPVTSEKIDIESLINECFDQLKHLEGYHNIEKKIIIQQETELFADRYRLALIFNNLISNAIIFRDVDKTQSIIVIDVNISDIVSIIVVDNGVGIHRNYVSKVFEMFFRGSTISKGAGLGLYNVKEAVEKMDGKITLDAFYREGAKFLIKFPNCLPE